MDRPSESVWHRLSTVGSSEQTAGTNRAINSCVLKQTYSDCSEVVVFQTLLQSLLALVTNTRRLPSNSHPTRTQIADGQLALPCPLADRRSGAY